MTHGDVNHTTATHYFLTGQPSPPLGDDLRHDWPSLGSVLAKLGRGRGPLPPYVAMRPKLQNDVPRFVEESHGQTAGWLGRNFDPLLIDADPNRPDYRVGDFALPAENLRPAALTTARASWSTSRTSGGRWNGWRPSARSIPTTAARLNSCTPRREAERSTSPKSPMRSATGTDAIRTANQSCRPAARRARRAARHRFLAQRRDQERECLLGHAQPQFPRFEDAAHAGGRPGVFGPAGRSGGPPPAR